MTNKFNLYLRLKKNSMYVPWTQFFIFVVVVDNINFFLLKHIHASSHMPHHNRYGFYTLPFFWSHDTMMSESSSGALH